MQRGVVDADNGDLAGVRGNEGGLIDQEGDLMAIGELAISIDGDAAVVVMVAQRDEDRRKLAQAGEKSKHMGQPLRHVEQVSGNKDPVGAEFSDGGDDTIVPWQISVEMEVAHVYRSSAGQGAVRVAEL